MDIKLKEGLQPQSAEEIEASINRLNNIIVEMMDMTLKKPGFEKLKALQRRRNELEGLLRSKPAGEIKELIDKFERKLNAMYDRTFRNQSELEQLNELKNREEALRDIWESKTKSSQDANIKSTVESNSQEH